MKAKNIEQFSLDVCSLPINAPAPETVDSRFEHTRAISINTSLPLAIIKMVSRSDVQFNDRLYD